MLLAHPDLAQRVLVLVLEVKRPDIVKHHRRRPGGPDRVGQARLGQGAAVVTGLAALQRGSQGVTVRGGHSEILKNPATVAAFEAGFTSRASTIAANASSPRTSNPSRE